MSFDLSTPSRPIEVGIILFGRTCTTEILDVAPIDYLHGLSNAFVKDLPIPDAIKAKSFDMNTHWITETGAPAKLTSGITMQATDSYESCPQLDIVLMGAYNMGYEPSEKDLAFVRKTHGECVAFLTICAGMLPAQMAGVLAGLTATGPRFMMPELNEKDPRTKWVEKRWCRDGKVWTSGALLNGLDMVREVAKVYWPELAGATIPLAGMPVREEVYHGMDGLPGLVGA
jgi:hypothetical protein